MPVRGADYATKLVVFNVAEGLLACRFPQRWELSQSIPLLADTLAMSQGGDRKVLEESCGQLRRQKPLYWCQCDLQVIFVVSCLRRASVAVLVLCIQAAERSCTCF